MYHLMRLELRKNKIGWYVKGALIANLILIGLMCFGSADDQSNGIVTFKNMTDVFMMSGVLVRGTFMVFASVLISKIIINEFKNRTILITFSYPVNRKKILSSKLMIIVCVTFVTIVISHIAVGLGVIGLNQIFHFTAPVQLSLNELYPVIIELIPFSLATAVASLVPLYFGMRKYSVPATIISSFLIVAATGDNHSNYMIANIIYIPLALAAVALGIVAFALRNIEHKDLT